LLCTVVCYHGNLLFAMSISYPETRQQSETMPIYEYKATEKCCDYCRDSFEIRQSIDAKPLRKCPRCHASIKKLVSRFRACVVETSDEATLVEAKIREYENEGKWSHAAELADKAGLEDRAKENYRKTQ